MSDDPPVWEGAQAALATDASFSPWVARIGPPRAPRSDEPPFVYLARAIVYQQLAGAAARTIHGRFVDALGGDVSPRAVLAAPEDTLRGAGLSRSKLKAIVDLAERIRAGDVPGVMATFEAMDDDEVVETLTRVWGVGVWTAQMFLMFRMQRPDVWPVLDLGVRSGWRLVHGLDEAPDARALEPLGDRLRPWRSAAAWYCWRALEITEEDRPAGAAP